MKSRLGVNVDHIATLRNARGEGHPDPISYARQVMNFGANSITIHLREDRRHIKDSDLKEIKTKLKIPLNLEIAATEEMLNIALKHKPNFVCIVPEKRKEVTTEGGLNLDYKKSYLKLIISKLKKNGSRVSLFIEPKISDVHKAKNLNTDCVEFHTGKICRLINEKKFYLNELKKIRNVANLCSDMGIEVHAGHGLTYKSAKIISKIKSIQEFNIGHFIIGEAIFLGLGNVIRKFKKLL